jgi:hypothetical protein
VAESEEILIAISEKSFFQFNFGFGGQKLKYQRVLLLGFNVVRHAAQNNIA